MWNDYWTPPDSLDEVRGAISGLRDKEGEIQNIDRVRTLVGRRKVLHYTSHRTSQPANTLARAFEVVGKNVKHLRLHPDGVPYWTLRQILRCSMTAAATNNLIAGLIGPATRLEDEIEQADRDSDPFVSRWDPSRMERDLALLQKSGSVSTGSIRYGQIISLMIRLKIAVTCGTNVPVTAKQEVLDVCRKTAVDFGYSPETVAATNLLALMAPSTNVAEQLHKRHAGIPVNTTKALPEETVPKVEKKPFLFMPKVVPSSPIPPAPPSRPSRPVQVGPSIADAPQRLISID